MNKSLSYLGVVCTLAIVLTSCGEGDKKPPEPATPATTSSKPAPADATPPAPTTENPGESATKTPATGETATGLIPPTDGENWAKTVTKGRIDPFAILALQPVEAALPNDRQISSASTGAATIKSPSIAKSGVDKELPSIKTSGGKGVIVATKNTKGLNTSKIARSGINGNMPKIIAALKPTGSKAAPKVIIALRPVAPRPVLKIVQPPMIAYKPLPEPLKVVPDVVLTPPQPKLSRTVGISGVIQVGGRTQVIVKLPNEAFSRYVEVGDQIYNGQITVKRVEGIQTLYPTVVLEEVGVEVNRRVGDM